MSVVRYLLVLLMLSTMVSPVWAAEEQDQVTVENLLSNMAKALRSLNYHGRFVYERANDKHGSMMTTYEIVHMLDNGMEYERVLKMDGEQNEIIREGKPVDCYQPGELILQGNLPQDLVNKLGSLQDYYDFSIAGDTRVAMRDAWRLDVTPKDKYRFGYSFVIDKENFMLLQGKMLSEKGQPLESFHFVQLKFVDIDRNKLNPVTSNYKTLKAKECMQHDAHQIAVDDAPWDLELPNGFMFCVYENSNSARDSIVYSDGLSTFSVFVSKGYELEGGMDTDSYREGSTLMYSQHSELKEKPYTVTVVGEVPEATAKKVATSLRHK